MVSEHRTYRLRADVEIAIAPAYRPPLDLLAEIETVWERERRQRGGGLSDGRLYCLVRYTPDRLTIAPSQYRYLLARRRHPELAARGLDVRALAVTGVVLCPDGIVFGRRGRCVASDAGLWEAAPAGGLAQPDPIRQILEEAEEEIGLPPTLIASPKIAGLVEDCASGVVDIVFVMHVFLDEKRIRQLHIARGSNEYEAITVIPVGSLPAFVCLLYTSEPDWAVSFRFARR